MKSAVKYFALTLSAFVLGMTINNYAISNVPTKIAVVDVNKVLSTSSEYKKINNEHNEKIKNLKTFVISKKELINKETNENKRQELTKKYGKELDSKKEEIKKDYNAKLTAYDQKLSNAIKQKAEAGNYELVLSKGVVFYGGTDITPEILKVVK